MNTNIKAVLFDLDGTIVDTEKYYQKDWARALEHFGYALDKKRLLNLRSFGRPFAEEQFKEWFGEDCSYWDIRAYRKQLDVEQFSKYGIQLKPGVEEFLQWLKKEEITIALVTADGLDSARRKLKQTGILQYFDKIISAEMVERGKPAPDIYRYACEKLKVAPEHTIAVEDSPNGINSAYAAGCKVIMVPDLSEPDEELKKMLYACVRSMDGIIPIIGSRK